MPASMSDSGLYRTGQTDFILSKPNGSDNLTTLYGLNDLAASVARFDPITGEKRKLRKSYKNQIADLPGKHSIPGPGEAPNNWNLANLARQPPRTDPSKPPPEFPKINERNLSNSLSFERSPATGIPDFSVTLLAADFDNSKPEPEQEQTATSKRAFGAELPFSKRLDVSSTQAAESSNDEGSGQRKSRKKRSKESSTTNVKRQKV